MLRVVAETELCLHLKFLFPHSLIISHCLTQPRCSELRYPPKRNENIYPLHSDCIRYKILITWLAMVKNWKQPRYPSTSEWIDTVGYIYAMKYYLVVKKEQTTDMCSDRDKSQKHYAS